MKNKLFEFHFLICFFVYPLHGFADGFDVSSNQKELINANIIDVGDAIIINNFSIHYSSDTLIEVAGKCFKTTQYLSWVVGKKAGLIFVDNSGTTKLALMEESAGSIKVDVINVVQSTCTSGIDSGLPNDSKQAMEAIKRKQDENNKYLENLNSQIERMKQDNINTMRGLKKKNTGY